MKSRLSSFGNAGIQRRQFLSSLGLGTVALLLPARLSAGILTAGNIVSLRCLDPKLSSGYLEGRKADGSIGLVSRPNATKDSGTRWQVVRRGEQLIALKCLAAAGIPRWLEGKPKTGAVGLTAPTKYPPDASAWRIVRMDSNDENIVALESFVAKTGARWLEGRAPNGSVGLASGADATPGGRWEVKIHPVPIDGGTRLNPAEK